MVIDALAALGGHDLYWPAIEDVLIVQIYWRRSSPRNRGVFTAGALVSADRRTWARRDPLEQNFALSYVTGSTVDLTISDRHIQPMLGS